MPIAARTVQAVAICPPVSHHRWRTGPFLSAFLSRIAVPLRWWRQSAPFVVLEVMVKLDILKIDAFASRVFSGNPAAVIGLPAWLPYWVLQAIAEENNLSATAYYVRRSDDRFDLRWFSPSVEVDLCGHATAPLD